MKDIKIQCVVWNDHYTSTDKVRVGEVTMEPMVHSTVGFLVAESDKMIALAHSKQHVHLDSAVRYLEVTYILKTDIVKRKNLD